MPSYELDDFLNATVDSGGIVSLIARRLNCTRQTVYNWMKEYPELAAAIQDEKEKIKDLAEGGLYALIKDKNLGAIIFYLKTQAKDRGYTEQVGVSTPPGESLTVKIVHETQEAKRGNRD